MFRRFDFRATLIAVAFFAIGFLVADRMTRAEAAPTAAPAADGDVAAGFSGTDGALVTKIGNLTYLIIVRGNKVYRMDAGGAGNSKPNYHLTE